MYDKMEGKYTEWPNPHISGENRQSGLTGNSPHNAIDVLQAEWPNQQRAHIALPHCAMCSRAEWCKQQIYVPKALSIRSLSS